MVHAAPGLSAESQRTLGLGPGRPDLGLHPLPAERNQGSLGKGLILGPEHGQHRMSLEHLVIPGSKEVLNKKVPCHKDSAASLTGLPPAEAWMV